MSLDIFRELDKPILLAFNGGGNLFIGYFVLTMTNALTWIPLYASLLHLIAKGSENRQKIIFVIGAVALGLFIVNGLNLGIVKPLVVRPCPLNSPGLQGIIVVMNHYMADGYSFSSSHTANTFVMTVFFCLLVCNRISPILTTEWGIAVSLTCPYLGVHYPSGVSVEVIFDLSVVVFIYFLCLRIYTRFGDKLHYISTKYTRIGYSFVDIDVIISVLILSFIYAAFRTVLSTQTKLCLKIQNISAFLIITIHSPVSTSSSFR